MVIPIVLTGSSLGKRQQELNFKVINTVKENVPFEEIKDAPENSDLDKLFKIDLASRYKKNDYIIEILKSGDSLLVTRALKCIWLYEDEHSQVICPDYLHHNVFQDVSTKIKVKSLTSISTHIRNEKRAEEFYNYCMNSKLPHQAYKFLIFTSSQLKADMIKNNFNTLQSLLEHLSDIKYFIGYDITLAECYLENVFKYKTRYVLDYFRYLYSIDNNKYLDWLEKYCKLEYFDINYDKNSRLLGRRITKDIVNKHKSRIFNKTPLYCMLLNKDILNKKSSVEEIKQYAIGLLPRKANKFWEIEFYKRYEFILDKIPKEERYHFIKKIFNDKYPNIEFEMSKQFYDNRYYDYLMMSAEEQESWAWRHLSAKTSIFADYNEDRTYTWYRYVNFDAAFENIKKCVLKTPDDSRRARLVNVLVKSAKTLDDVNKLLSYYYERHVNETQKIKDRFLRELWKHHYVFEFDESTFAIYDKILHSTNAYDNQNPYLNYVLIYHVLNNLEFPKCLKDYLQNAFFSNYVDDFELIKLSKRLKDQQKEKVYQYLLQVHVDRLKQLNNNGDDSNIYNKSRVVSFLKRLQECFEKSDDFPIIALEYVQSNADFFSKSESKTTKLTQSEMLRLLKNDVSLAVDTFDLLKYEIETYDSKYIPSNRYLHLNTYINKIKTYFPGSIARLYLKFFTDALTAESKDERRLMFTSVYAIFQLADETTKLLILTKYLPVNSKIDYGVIDKRHLYIQEAICKFACFSRPPVPFSKVLQYVTGDYLKYCVPMFNFYLANLPPTPRLQFLESLINSPVSVQKHVLRLAFKCYDAGDLKNKITNILSNTKNVSLRMFVYFKMFKYLQHKDEQTQSELFKIILDIISDLNEDDDDTVFSLLTGSTDNRTTGTVDNDFDFYSIKRKKKVVGNYVNSLPQALRVKYCETVYKTLEKMPVNNPKYSSQLLSALKSIIKQIVVIDIVFVRAIVDDYLKKIFEDKLLMEDRHDSVLAEKRYLTGALIAFYASKGNVDSAKELIDYVMTGCLKIWDKTNEIKNEGVISYYSIRYLFDFINKFLDYKFEFCSNYSSLNPILEHIRQYLDSALPMFVSSTLGWKLRLSIVCNMLIDEFKQIQKIYLNSTQEVIKTYAVKVKEIVDDYISKGVFHLSRVVNIADAIKWHIEKLVSNRDLIYDIHVQLSREFVNYKSLQTILLAIVILPRCSENCVESKDCFNNVLKDIENVDNFEVQACYYHKFHENINTFDI